jgi:hypothetical protein
MEVETKLRLAWWGTQDQRDNSVSRNLDVLNRTEDMDMSGISGQPK